VKCSSEETFGSLISKVAPEFQEERVKTIVLLIFSVSKFTSCMSYIYLLCMFSLNIILQRLFGFGNSIC